MKALATNDIKTQLLYYAEEVDYYDFGQVIKDVIRKDLEHEVTTWPTRVYSILDDDERKITPNNDGLTAEFRMTYTRANPTGNTSRGIVHMTVRLKSVRSVKLRNDPDFFSQETGESPTWQIVGIKRKEIQTTRQR